MTFAKVDGVPETLADGTDLLEELAEEYGDTSSSKNSQPDTIDYEPDLPEDHYTELEETTNPDEVYDAIAHANNRDPTSIINSEPTEDRGRWATLV